MKKNIIILAALVLALIAVPVSVFAESAFNTADPDGRTVAEKGTKGSVSGILDYADSEWYLKAGDKTYDLHLGLFGHDEKTTASLKAGDKAHVEGFILDNHIAPISLSSNGKTYNFRAQDGRPLWSGQGSNRNAAGSWAGRKS